MTPYKKFFTGMIGIVGGVCLGVGIGLGIVPLLSAGLLIVVVSIGLLVSTMVNPVKTPVTFQTHSIHAAV
jgi:hypothetical protein